MSFKGKIVAVTGAAGGIGQVCGGALRDEFAYFATCALNGKTPSVGRPEDAAAALEATLAAEESARTGNVIRIGGN